MWGTARSPKEAPELACESGIGQTSGITVSATRFLKQQKKKPLLVKFEQQHKEHRLPHFISESHS